MYEYHWLYGTLVQPDLLNDLAELYSHHYGVWGLGGPKPGAHIKLGTQSIRKWLTKESVVVWATALGEIVGYAIAVQGNVDKRGSVAWVTQLVVDEEHRQQDVAKTLLFTVWRFTHHYAWGLMSANPFAVRALEKATRRRCNANRILADADTLAKVGTAVVSYLPSDTEYVINANESRVNTKFFLDHSKLPSMLSAAVSNGKPWTLGQLPEGWEWFAFTFRDQPPIGLANTEIQEMLSASDAITKRAYSRMAITGPWAKNQDTETQFIIEQCALKAGSSVIDFGCGDGRHAVALARSGMVATGVDYIRNFIDSAREKATREGVTTVDFVVDDCRTIRLNRQFDTGICLYDVIGSYADENSNFEVLANLTRHVKPGGFVLLSVMNMELTERLAKNWFSLDSDPDRLLTLQPSRIMERTGDVFDPEFYMIDRDTKIVYRKEQFTSGTDLPEELIVRDRRYTRYEIQNLCGRAGLDVLWIRLVRSGGWSVPLAADDPKAKEILVLCRRKGGHFANRQQNLFS